MKEREAKDDAAEDNSVENNAGDVETAGEMTAAAIISGPEDTRPVGADTMVKVDDEKGSAEGFND